MHPELLGFSAYSTFLVLGDLVGAAVATYGAQRYRLNLKQFARALVILTVVAFIGAKFYGLIERGGSLGPVADEVFTGYRYPGALIAVAGGLLLVGRRGSRISPGMLADIIAPAFGFAMSIVRIGCLLAGCCSGTVTALPWAIKFPAHSQPWTAQVHAGILSSTEAASLPVHPLQVYFGLLAFSLGCFCVWFDRHKAYDGQVFLIYISVYGTGQFLLEFLRFSPLPHVQYMTLAVAIAAGAVLVASTHQTAWSRRIA